MTGKIEVLCAHNNAGSIRSIDGVLVRFHLSEVVSGDASDMAVGHNVTFDMERGGSPRAFNIRMEKRRTRDHDHEKLWQAIRYVDFDQNGNVREYKFERVSVNGESVGAIVSADVSLFSKHHVGIQDGPMLCLRLVMAEIDGSSATGQSPFRRSLTDQDMIYHLSKVTPPKKRYSRRPTTSSFPSAHAWRGTAPRT